MREFSAILSGIIMLWFTAHYAIDILKHRVKPARSSRYMYFLLLALALIQQGSLGSTWSLVLIATELLQSGVILVLSFKYGHGGFTKIDIVCYILLGVNISVWLLLDNPFLAIHILIIADLVATFPTIIKTKRHPETETPLYWASGSVAALLAILSESRWTYSTLVFFIYLLAINAYVAILASKRKSSDGLINYRNVEV